MKPETKTTTEPTAFVSRVAYETLRFFEIDLPDCADPETYCDANEALLHLAGLILSGMIYFKSRA